MNSTPPTADDLAVVVCAYTEERWTDIVAAIESVQAQQPAPGEIVLVVDHNETLLVRAREQFQQGVAIVANTHKRGLSGARNTGIDNSDRSIIAFLDDDAYAHPGWVAALLEPYADANVLGVGGPIEPEWQTARPEWWPTEFDWVVGCTYTGIPRTRHFIRNPIGASMSVRREVFEVVGGFTTEVGRVGKHPVGGEETELFIRAQQHWPGSKAVFAPDAVVSHRVGASRATWSYFRRRCWAEGLSKAVISRLVGAGDGLSSEWDYTLKVLPLAALRNLVQGKPARSGAVIAGLAITTGGYLRGRLARASVRTLAEVPQSIDPS